MSSKEKSKQLGMPYGTAQNRLRKMIMFSLIQETEKDICFRCGEKIKNIKNFSIEHKQPWLHEDIKLFWELSNITFSHLKCNSGSRRNGEKIKFPPGMNWCAGCKEFLPIKEFWKHKNKKNGLSNYCKKHSWKK